MFFFVVEKEKQGTGELWYLDHVEEDQRQEGHCGFFVKKDEKIFFITAKHGW